MSPQTTEGQTAETPPQSMIDAVAWDVGNHTYANETELNREITSVMNKHQVPPHHRRAIRNGIVSNWKALRDEFPDDGTWSP